jgi:Tfp pilus assembly protein PilV
MKSLLLTAIKPFLLTLLVLSVACLSPLDKTRQRITQVIATQHQMLASFLTWDKAHQMEIVKQAKNKPLAKKHLTEYRKRRDVLTDQVVKLINDDDENEITNLSESTADGVVLKTQISTQKMKSLIDDFESFCSKTFDDPFGINRANPFNHPRFEILLNTK